MGGYNPKYIDAQRFSDNAASLLLERGQLPDFFASLNYDITQNRTSDGYIGKCPVCKQSNCLIGLHGARHCIWWRCLSNACSSNGEAFRTPRNLLSMVKFILGSQSEAFKVIADFLGYAGRSFDITNGKKSLSVELLQPPSDSPSNHNDCEAATYIWLVPDEHLKSLFDQAGIRSMIYKGNVPEERPVFSLLNDVTVAASGGRFDPLEWDFLPPADIRKKAIEVMKRVMAISEMVVPTPR